MTDDHETVQFTVPEEYLAVREVEDDDGETFYQVQLSGPVGDLVKEALEVGVPSDFDEMLALQDKSEVDVDD